MSDTLTIQEAWEAAGGNPGIKATKAELLDALKSLDEVCDEVDSRPPPVSNTTAALIDLLRQRDAAGRAKYGATLDRTDLTHAQWLQHMAEELLDGAGYALAALRESEARQTAESLFDDALAEAFSRYPEAQKGLTFFACAIRGPRTPTEAEIEWSKSQIPGKGGA